QAEDGIRGKLVTGVQTCALPISLQQAARSSMDPAIETHLAVALRNTGQSAAALAALEQATTRQPPFTPAFVELGTLLRKQRRFEIGRASCRERASIWDVVMPRNQ